MKNLKHILLATTLLLASLAMGNTVEVSLQFSIPQKQQNQFFEEGIHLRAVIQPESIHHVVPSIKVSQPTGFKLGNEYSFDFFGFNNYKLQNSFIRQDINRCENVSILLFPYHIFW